MSKIKNCPKCGGTIEVSFLYQYSINRRIGKRGKLLKKKAGVFCGYTDACIAHCTNDKCNVNWEADEFYLDNDEQFVDLKYT